MFSSPTTEGHNPDTPPLQAVIVCKKPLFVAHPLFVLDVVKTSGVHDTGKHTQAYSSLPSGSDSENTVQMRYFQTTSVAVL